MVVDAPTDWSLAGPLWELALDEAPVDEILDILIRRGIRTSPSFAIVRVEGEAVRALVRGDVPVCFERAGEPVRLDATGATTWLEGLISGARRVLVGAVDGEADMPYLVSTGVVLVSGLALPCAPAGALVTDTGSTELADVENSLVETTPEPVAAEPGAVPQPVSVEPAEPEYEPVSVASGSLPVAGSEPRVVDLSRVGGRSPAYTAPEARSFAPATDPPLPEQRGLAGLNGHVPAVLEPESGGITPYDHGGRADGPVGWSPSGTGRPGFPADDNDDDVPAAFPEDAPEAADQSESSPSEAPAPVEEVIDLNDAEAADTEPARFDDGSEGPGAGPLESPGDGRFADVGDDEFEARGDGPLGDRDDDDLQGRVDDLFQDRGDYGSQALGDGRLPDRHDDDRFQDQGRDLLPGRGDGRLESRDDGPFQARADDDGFEDRGDDGFEGRDDDRFAEAADEPDRSDSPVFGRSDFAASTFPAADYRAPVEEPESPFAPRPTDQPERPAAAARPVPVDSFDDLLIDPADGERPKGPSPADLPNFDPPSVSLPLPSALNLNGANGAHQPGGYDHGQPEIPSAPNAFGAPAAWPPAPATDPGRSAQDDDSVLSGRPSSFFRQPDSEAATPVPEVDDPWAPPSRASEPVQPRQGYRSSEVPQLRPLPAPETDSDEDPSDPDALPFRVRGQSLRPEQRSGTMAGMNGSRLLGPSDPASPFNPSPPAGINGHGVNGIGGSESGVAEAPDAPTPAPAPSGSLLLPAFFRGARAARKSGPEAPAAPSSRQGGASEQPWPGANGQGPAAWVPPVRRGQPGTNGSDAAMPPAMPGALRGSGDDVKTPGSGNGSGPSEHREPPRLLGVWCDAGHVTSPDRDECRVCGLKVPSQAPILVARPPLGVLIFDNGDRVEVDRPVVLGRDPKPVSSPDPESPVLHAVPSATGQVSRTHAEVRASGWDVVLTDLDAMNGTALTLPGESPVAIEPGVPTVIVPGSRVDLGGESGFVFEIDG